MSRLLAERFPDVYRRVPIARAWATAWREPAFVPVVPLAREK